MKKTLVALAALAATSAFAQSSVTISGNIDLGMQTTKENGIGSLGTANQSGLNATSNGMLGGGDLGSLKTSGPIGNGAAGWTSSALKLEVKEDMGAGKTAGYVHEMNVFSWGAGADSANQGLNTTRQAFAYIGDDKAGTVSLGYQYTLDDQIQGGIGRVTPTGNIAGRVQNFSLKAQPNYALGSGEVAREGEELITSGAITRANSFQYASPVIAGFQGLAQYGKTTADSTDITTAAEGKNTGKIAAYAVKYANGPLTVGYAHTTLDSEIVTLAGTTEFKAKSKLSNLAANYVIGDAAIFANYFDRKMDMETVTVVSKKNAYEPFSDGGSLNRKGHDFGVKYAIGATTLYATTGKGTYSINYDGTAQSDLGVRAHLVGVTYDFSKRTSLNVYAGTTKVVADGVVLDADVKKTQTGFGLRHQF